MRKSWKQKYFGVDRHKLEKLDKDYSDMSAGEVMLIATPTMIANYIDTIPSGKILDNKTIRKDLALSRWANNTCPLTYGIFLRVLSEYHYEQYSSHHDIERITPFWRAIPSKSPVLKKLSFDTQFIFDRQNEERNG